MAIRKVVGLMILAGSMMLALGTSAWAQTDALTNSVAGPDYGSGAGAGLMSNGNFNTPEADGRPGIYFFALGARAFEHGDYTHAIAMYKVAASWAYKPAEYNLGVMYFKGQGVPVDHARGAAWMVLAAERGQAFYVKARDLMVTELTQAQFARTDRIWSELRPTYGDTVALRRAKAQWAWTRTHETGTRVGGAVGNLRVGAREGNPGPAQDMAVTKTAGQLMRGGSVDSSIAYRQFEESDNPYSPIFLKNRRGTATVGPLQPVKSRNPERKPKKQGMGDPDPPASMPRSV